MGLFSSFPILIFILGYYYRPKITIIEELLAVIYHIQYIIMMVHGEVTGKRMNGMDIVDGMIV